MIDDAILEADDRMERAVEAAREDFSTVRTGRASPGLFAKLMVEYYGAMTPLQQLASINVPEARTVLITPYDRAALPDVEKALRTSDMSVNPSNDGITIRVVLPQLTDERRREYVKVVRGKAEEAKISVRGARGRAMKELARIKDDGEAGEDDVVRAEKEVEASSKKHVDLIDEALKTKESELLTV